MTVILIPCLFLRNYRKDERLSSFCFQSRSWKMNWSVFQCNIRKIRRKRMRNINSFPLPLILNGDSVRLNRYTAFVLFYRAVCELSLRSTAAFFRFLFSKSLQLILSALRRCSMLVQVVQPRLSLPVLQKSLTGRKDSGRSKGMAKGWQMNVLLFVLDGYVTQSFRFLYR